MNSTLLEHPPACAVSAAQKLSEKFAALGHPARIAILRQLASSPACCCKDVVQRMDLAQSTVSQHLKILVEAGLVRYSPDKQRSRYQIDREALAGMGGTFAAFVDDCCTIR